MAPDERAAYDGRKTYPRSLATEMHRTRQDYARLAPRCLDLLSRLRPDADVGALTSAPAHLCGQPRDVARVVSPKIGDVAVMMASLRIRHFSVPEVVRPNHPAIAREYGYRWFIPPFFSWPVFGVLLVVCDVIRGQVGAPAEMRNAWRPASYNRRVSGSTKRSDHPNAGAADLWWESSSDADVADGVARGLHLALDLDLSMGVGFRHRHIGVLSVLRERVWSYNGAKRAPVDIEDPPWTGGARPG